MGFNAVLLSAQAHRDALAAMLAKCRLGGVWGYEADGDGFLAALRRDEADVVYLFCHARGGQADLGTRPPALELQAVGSAPSLIRAAALAEGLQFTHHPLVILNGCNTAAFSPDALSPFIRTLVRDCEAAGAIGTVCSMRR
jgi:CHAT domain